MKEGSDKEVKRKSLTPERRTEWFEYRTKLLELREKGRDYYDNQVLVLSGGTIVLSVTFLGQFKEGWNLVSAEYLVAAWLFLSISILSTLFSALTSMQSMDQSVKGIDEGIRKDEEPDSKENNIWEKATSLLNSCSGMAFLFGIVLYGVFSIKNIYANIEIQTSQKNGCEKKAESRSIERKLSSLENEIKSAIDSQNKIIRSLALQSESKQSEQGDTQSKSAGAISSLSKEPIITTSSGESEEKRVKEEKIITAGQNKWPPPPTPPSPPANVEAVPAGYTLPPPPPVWPSPPKH